jgi:hypothetical protein
MSPTPPYHEPQPDRSGLLTALFAGALIALIAANIYLFIQLDHMRGDLATVRQTLSTELGNLRDASSVTSASQLKHIEAMKSDLEAARAQARDQARSMSSQAKAEAQAHMDQVARQIQAEEAKVQQQVSSELSEVKSAANTANEKIADVTTDVGGVKTEVKATQAQLQKTIADLKSTIGDLGVQSGLIATNSTELAALRLRGERNYIEFTVPKKSKQPVRVGDITLLLKDVNPKKNTYHVEVRADDKVMDKKDKGINEPVQFYTSKAPHQPSEIVVNSVQKDQIKGYLSVPKDQAAR